MKLDRTEKIDYPCPSSLWNCNERSSPSVSDSNEIRIRKTGTLSGEYWKSNYYVFLQSGHHGFASHCQLQDEIENELLREHKSVILSTLFDVYTTLEVCDVNSGCLVIDREKICEYELEGNFIEIVIQMEEFEGWEAKEFVTILRERFDCRRMYFELISEIKPIMHQTFTYLFYLSIKITDLRAPGINKGLSTLDTHFENIFNENLNLLKNKLRNLPELPSLEVNLKKIAFSIVMALSGVFINKFYNPKSTPNFDYSIPQQQPQKKIKHIDSSRRRVRCFSSPHFEIWKKIKF